MIKKGILTEYPKRYSVNIQRKPSLLSSFNHFLSKEPPKTIVDVNDILFEYNPSRTNKAFTLPSGNYIDVNGKSYSGTLTLKPYSSIILIKN